MLAELPSTFRGHPKDVRSSAGEEGSGPEASADYGEGISVVVTEEHLTEDTEDGEPTLMSARDLLAANFLLGLACGEGSYHGNALPLGEAGYPKTKPGERIWFSCAVEAAEGDEDFTAHTVGWTSGRTAWLVLAPDRRTVRSLMTALHEAAA